MSNIIRTCLLFVITLVLLPAAHARIGESQNTLEGRLLKGRTAIPVPSRMQRAMLDNGSVPYRWIYKYYPEKGITEALYFKPAEADIASTSDLDTPGRNPFPHGWIVHVIYLRGQSVFEAYRREGAKMTSYEREGLLIVNKGDSHWQLTDSKETEPRVIGYTMERADGEVRALQKGNTLIFYNPKFDAVLMESKNEADSEADEEAQEKAPDSLRGF